MTPEEAVEYALAEQDAASPAASAPGHRPPGRPTGGLTGREEEVAVLVARGLTNRQVAARLGISEHTARTHVGKILKKLDLHSRAQLAAWAAEHEPRSSQEG